MPLVRGLLLAHLCASALLLALLWTVVLVQHVARRSRGTAGVPAPRQDGAGAPPAGPVGEQRSAPSDATASAPGRGSARATSPSS